MNTTKPELISFNITTTPKQGDILNHVQGDKTHFFYLPRWHSTFTSSSLIFHNQTVANSLPTNSQLHRYNKNIPPSCSICNDKAQTQLHIFNKCSTALAQGRYTWRHDSLLNNIIIVCNKLLLPHPDNDIPSTFKIMCDIPSSPFFQHIYPDYCNINNQLLRPDIIIHHQTKKTFFIIELTVPYVHRMNEASRIKESKYSPLHQHIQNTFPDHSIFLHTIQITVSARSKGRTRFKGQIFFKGQYPLTLIFGYLRVGASSF
jgi:hypothetical protein